jgi:hypothetical protein
MGSRSRRKGASYEREVGHRLATVYPSACRGAQQSRQGDVMADVEGTPWWVECKVGQRIDIIGAFRQAELASDGRPVLCAVKRNAITGKGGPEEFVCLRWDDFLALVGEPKPELSPADEQALCALMEG